jgi:ferrochelatase
MRYGTPSIASRIETLRVQGCDRILLVPLYPQYSAATTGSVCDAAFNALKTMRWQPTLRVAPPYYDDSYYIDALATSIRGSLSKLDFEPEVVLASFHGLPKAYHDKGDPYYCHCHKTTRLLREVLGWSEECFLMTFQSRFGKQEWLQPYTYETVKRLANKGTKKLAVITPGFAADCIETLEEIALRGKEVFHSCGGKDFAVLPCLNDSAAGISFLTHHVARELAGWL